MTVSNASTRKPTRIQRQKQEIILEAALEVFSAYGFRGATIDQVAEAAHMSKPNLLYYFPSKEAMHRVLIDRLLKTWLDPLHAIDEEGDPMSEISKYIKRKMDMARDYPRESRLFANEILQGAPRIKKEMQDLKKLVDEKTLIIRHWIKQGKIADVDPYYLLFSIWATTQHYADFDAQVKTVLGDHRSGPQRFDEATHFLDRLFIGGLKP